jgi:hypothetical protein
VRPCSLSVCVRLWWPVETSAMISPHQESLTDASMTVDIGTSTPCVIKFFAQVSLDRQTSSQVYIFE